VSSCSFGHTLHSPQELWERKDQKTVSRLNLGLEATLRRFDGTVVNSSNCPVSWGQYFGYGGLGSVSCGNEHIVHVTVYPASLISSSHMAFIMAWNVRGELVMPKNITSTVFLQPFIGIEGAAFPLVSYFLMCRCFISQRTRTCEEFLSLTLLIIGELWEVGVRVRIVPAVRRRESCTGQNFRLFFLIKKTFVKKE